MTAIMSANKKRCFKLFVLTMALVLLFNVSVSAQQELPRYEAAETTTQPETTVATTKAAEEESTEEATTIDSAKYDELQEQYEELEKEKEENEQKLNEVKEEIADQKNVVSDIYDKIDATQTRIDALGTTVDLLNRDINYTENQISIITEQLTSLSDQIAAAKTAISEKETVLEETYELLKMRIRAMYMAGSGSNLEFLLTSQDFSTLLTRTELLVRVAEHDNNLMATLESDIKILEELETTLTTSVSEQELKADQLDKQSTVLANKKADAQSASAELEEKKAEIQVQYDQAKDELNKLDKESAEYIARIKKQEEQLLELSSEMEEFIKNNGSSSSDPDEEEVSEESVSGEEGEDTDAEVEKPSNPAKGMIFPIKTAGAYISSPYGMRTHPITGEYKMHSGVDITAGGINNEPIYASQAGEVIFAGTKGGYGNYIIVDHGKGITTCYAHCNSIGVTVGQQVKQGQVIGKVGSTGASTGPHLHYEVRIDGATTNPMNYVSIGN